LEDYTYYHLWPESSHKKIRIGDGSILSVEGIGSITIKHQNKDGIEKKIKISNVHYIPKLEERIISPQVLSQKNQGTWTTQENTMLYYKNGEKILTAQVNNYNVFNITGMIMTSKCAKLVYVMSWNFLAFFCIIWTMISFLIFLFSFFSSFYPLRA
jgi:hypothetical protein